MTQTNKGQRLLIFGTALAYCLIGIEIVIMISPFALYFYSVYGPILNALSASPLTSWSTEFFLPHMVFFPDPLITAISYLQLSLIAGLILFFSAAIPLYYGRFTGKGVVRMSFYSKIRHPQYLFLAISGFGLMLYWPRFIILVMYITMLFVYYFLARNEEWRMKNEEPEAYERYMASTPMFLPGEPGGKLFNCLFGRIQPKWLGLVVAYGFSLFVALMLAMGLRHHTIGKLPVAKAADGCQLISVFPRPSAEIIEVYQAALRSAEVREIVNSNRVNAVYLLPGDFFLNALLTEEDRRFSNHMLERFPEILEWHQHKFSGGLGRFFRIFYNFVSTWSSLETNYEIERLIFVQVADATGTIVPAAHIFDIGLQRHPVMLVDLDAASHEIITVTSTTDKNKWGKIPMPIF